MSAIKSKNADLACLRVWGCAFFGTVVQKLEETAIAVV
jgi:hypothetical protein